MNQEDSAASMTEEKRRALDKIFNKKTTFQDSFSEENWTVTYKDHADVDINSNLRRVAKAIASVEDTPEKQLEWEANFYDLLTDFKGVPGGRTMSNAGTEWSGTTLMNCFVGPRSKFDIDSIEGIYSHLLSQSQTLKSEGGWGENFSYIRPRGTFINGIGVETPGAVKFMEIFDKASEIITSGSGKKSSNSKAKGKIRKGAMMGVLDVWHPDIIEFITAKQQAGRLTKFNISVNCTDEFMQRVNRIRELEAPVGPNEEAIDRGPEIEELDKWDLIFPDVKHPKYKKEWNGDMAAWKAKGYPFNVVNTVSVKYLWNLIMESTYNRAEPGVLFLDRANYFNPLAYGETIFATNPCLTGDSLVTTDKGQITFIELTERYNSGEKFKALTFNTKTKALEWEDIVFADKTRTDANVIELELEDGSIVKLTPDHEVYTENRGYVKAAQLSEDDILISIA